MTKITVKIENHEDFRWNSLTGLEPPSHASAITAGTLEGPARRLFMAEVEYNTINYVVYSDNTPLLWHGAFQWIMPPRDLADIDEDDYLFALEIIDDLY